ncbi:hypothetical protein ACGFYZ_40920 [Streptomyces sp. NPDC048330]|uniref:hypothetical protein n=1 Tax=Streptomyces sp. NPDC048330 TaxID=3365533 RepID=UPI003713AD44
MKELSSLTPDEFGEALECGTGFLYSVEAAVWLLRQHAKWLSDPKIRSYVTGGIDEQGNLWAGLDVPKLGAAIDDGEFVGPGSVVSAEDIAVLRFALSFYGNSPVSLRYEGDNLSKQSIDLIGKALLMANGYSVED